MLRESLAHNTMAISGESHSLAATAFSWRTTATGRLLGAGHAPEWEVAADHDGYQNRFGVRHVRKIRRLRSGIAVEDSLSGDPRPSAVELRFLCHPDIEAALDGNDITICGRDGALCRIVPPRGFCAAIASAQVSLRFGQMTTTRQLILAGELSREPALTQVALSEPSMADCSRTLEMTPVHAGALNR